MRIILSSDIFSCISFLCKIVLLYSRILLKTFINSSKNTNSIKNIALEYIKAIKIKIFKKLGLLGLTH